MAGEKIGPPQTYPAGVADKYGAELQGLVEQMARSVEQHVKSLFTAQDASPADRARSTARALIRRWEKAFRDKADGLARQMVGRVDRDAKGKLVRTLRELSGDATLSARTLREGSTGKVIKAAIEENVKLIRSIPTKFLGNVQEIVTEAITRGKGLADIVPQLQHQHGLTLKRARLIANDQVRKTTAALNTARAEANGIRKFEWVHSGGGREPRQLHLQLDGQVFEYADLPVIDERTGERGVPGQLINCRCTARPILDFGPVDGPGSNA